MKKSKLLITLFVCFAVLLSTTGIVAFAKYVGDYQDSHVQSSSNFFFTSKLIEKTTTMTLYGGGDQSLSIDLNNFENSFSNTPSDITYSLSGSASNSFTDFVFKSDGSVINGGTLTGGINDTENIVVEFQDGYSDGTVVTINFVATAPYTKTLSMRITLKTLPELSFSVEDSVDSYFCKLILVVNRAVASNVLEIEWDPSEINIDSNNRFFMSAPTKLVDVGNNYYNIKLDSMNENSVLEIIFFKTNATDNFESLSTFVVGNKVTL